VPDRKPFHIADLSRVKRGWRWKVTFHYRGQNLTNPYCTGPDGSGLFASRMPDEKYQLRKSEEFSLPTHHQGAREGITKFFTEREAAARKAAEEEKEADKSAEAVLDGQRQSGKTGQETTGN